MRGLDFSDAPRVAGKAYNGANGKKIAVRIEGWTWILKFPPNVSERPNEQSYSNSCISEHLGSSIFNMLGIPAQDTMLGSFSNGTVRIVCACRDFTSSGLHLFDFCSIKNTVLDTGSGGTGTELDDILSTIDSQNFMDPSPVTDRFWQMFVVDAWIGNFDRHNGNWGFLIDEVSGICSLAPVFDCGSCLLPQADENIMKKVLSCSDEMNARIFTFPTSMIKVGGRKLNYYDFLHQSGLPFDLKKALDLLLPGIMSFDIGSLIESTPYLTCLQRDFYIAYLTRRRELLFSSFSIR